MKRVHAMSVILNETYKGLRAGWNINRHLPDNFPAHFLAMSSKVKPQFITQLEDTAGLKTTGFFDTHPSTGDRIRRARQAGVVGLFNGEGPASLLFANFEVISKQITLLHYSDDLGIPLPIITLMPVDSPAN